MFGALGIRGAVYEASKAWNSSKFATFDIDKDGWLTAKEIFDFANSTTITYTGVEYSQGHINTAQTPQFYGGVTSGDVPIAMYWPNVTTVVVPLLQQQGRWHEEVVPNWFKHNPPPCSGSRGEPCASSNSMFKGDAGRTGYFNPQILHGPLYAPTITDESTLLWNVSLSKLLLSSPVVDENVAFFTSSNPPEPTNLYALELKTGNVLWTFTTEGESFSSLALCEGKIFFGTKNTSDVTRGTLYALDEDAGTLIWNLSIGGHMSSPAISEGMLIFTTTITDATSSAWALNVTTGVPIWNLTLFDRSIASPTVFEGRVFFATYEGNITAIEQFTGHQIWSTLIPNRIFSTPAAAHGLLFIGTLGNPAPPGVLALNIASGFQYWNTPFPAPIYSSPSVDLDRGTVIACSQDGTIRALSEISGSIIWENVIGPVNMSSPAISKWRIIYTGSLDSRIYSLNERTGDVLGYFDTGSPIESSPAGYGPHVLIGSLGGRFLCFGPEFPVHDVAVRGVEPSQTTVKIGQIIDAQVNVTNHGNVPETFNLICAYNNTDVWQPPTYLTPTMFNNDAVTLSPGENATLTHQLNTTAMGIGAYTLIAFVPQVAYEGDTSDNTFMSVELRIIIPGDVNGDNQVNILDCIILANHFGHINGNGHIPGTKEWKDCLNSDINSDSRVNILDCIILAGHFGQKSP